MRRGQVRLQRTAVNIFLWSFPLLRRLVMVQTALHRSIVEVRVACSLHDVIAPPTTIPHVCAWCIKGVGSSPEHCRDPHLGPALARRPRSPVCSGTRRGLESLARSSASGRGTSCCHHRRDAAQPGSLVGASFHSKQRDWNMNRTRRYPGTYSTSFFL